MKRRTKILILTPNENGKLEFTQEELENLIDDIYEEGYKCGKADALAITWPDGVRTQLYGYDPFTEKSVSSNRAPYTSIE